MRNQLSARTFGAWLAGVLLVPFLAGSVLAQTSTGSISGLVSDSSGRPVANADIIARNITNGVERRTTARQTGGYNLPGLVPATYDVTARQVGMGAQTQRIQVGIGQSLIVNFRLTNQAVELEEITIGAPAETRTSEVATNVTQAQINELPSSSRNFLDLAVLAPGTTIDGDRLDGTSRKFSAGAQSSDQTNIFIDGASYKNDLIHGGSVGQDRSRGNPKFSPPKR